MLFEIQLYNKDQNKYDLEIESILKNPILMLDLPIRKWPKKSLH
ncbi:hypothetical protein LEP1GSC170_3646 [Leptospira interrogans serovar Bataviae str. HAI135]|nr:hypothetical protein LEP1GSC170_3646 [Leptospira interrogans serovar Bataviae str. HAI135]